MHDFTYHVEINDIPAHGFERALEADRAQRVSIARWLNIPEICSLTGTLRLDLSGEILTVSGSIQGCFRRQCGVSLEMFEEEISETFRFDLTRADPVAGGRPSSAQSPNDFDGSDVADMRDYWDMPDFWPETAIDLGDILVQQASLAMMTHPRKPGAVAMEEEAPQEVPSPFAGLKEMVLKK